MKRLLALMLCAVSLGALAQNGVCCDPDGVNYAGPGACFGVGEPSGTWNDADGVACDLDCENYDPCNSAGECYNPSSPPCANGGCTDPTACNYDPTAEVNDGSCEYLSCIGCQDPAACNYDEVALIAGACDYDSCAGCTNPEASNYDATALIDDGSCEILGCTIPQACNYDAGATVNDGSCDFESCFGAGCTAEQACNYDPTAIVLDGSCIFPSDLCDDGDDMTMNDVIGDDCICQGEAIGGCMDIAACNYDSTVVVDDGSCNYTDALGVCGGACTADADADGICDDVDDCLGTLDACGICNGPGAIYECGCEDFPDGDCDCDGSQVDALGDCGGSCDSDYNNNGVCDNEEVFGCTYADALNYNPNATDDDGSCISPCVGEVNTNVFDWNGDYNVSIADFLMMLSVFGDTDVDFDGVWDSSDECIDTEACNYDVDPSEPCAYIDVLGVCGGGCEGDGDNDGICDDVDDCIGVVDECGVCNGPGPTQVVIDDIIITYDSVFLPLDEVWFVYAVDADTLISYECEPTCGSFSTSTEYTLTVESSPAVDPALGTTYRFYINLQGPTDQVSAVYGNNQATLAVNAPNGVYNSAFNASWNASGINPAFLPSFPDIAADTYATIGLEGPASASGISGAVDPSIVQDGDQMITPFFQNDGVTSLLSDTQQGAAWYVLNTAANASPQDGNLRVLVMQVTSTGNVSGQLNYQVFPQGNGQLDEKYLAPFDGTGTFQGQLFEVIVGCMDEAACNFDPCANLQSQAFCNYPNANGDCD